MNWIGEASMGMPKYWLQFKRCPSTWSTPIIWLGSVGLSSKQAHTFLWMKNKPEYGEYASFCQKKGISLHRG
jgi:hypothetical protein